MAQTACAVRPAAPERRGLEGGMRPAWPALWVQDVGMEKKEVSRISMGIRVAYMCVARDGSACRAVRRVWGGVCVL